MMKHKFMIVWGLLTAWGMICHLAFEAFGEEGAADGKLRIIAFGAHPDDAEYKVGGTAAMWAALGHHVKLVSVTNGDIGHWRMAGGPLGQRRRAEVERVAEALGTEIEVLDIHDGELMPTLENRKKIEPVGISVSVEQGTSFAW